MAVNEGNPNYESCLAEFFPTWRTVYYPTTTECLKAVSGAVAAADSSPAASIRHSKKHAIRLIRLRGFWLAIIELVFIFFSVCSLLGVRFYRYR